MDNNDFSIATATLHFSDLYYFEHKCFYAFDISFDKTSTLLFYHLTQIPAGREKDTAKEFLNAAKQYFSTAGIHDGSDVAVLFSADGRVVAISAQGNGLWVDVCDGISPHIPPKEFSNLRFKISSLSVF